MPEREATASPEARQGAYALRAKTRWLAPSRREQGCGSLCVEHVDQTPVIELRRQDGAPRARWKGLMTCGHIWTCPVCSQNLRAKRAERIAAAVRGMGGRWQMLTVTVRHRNGMPLKELAQGLSAAWRATRQGGRIQRIWTERVTASARAFEVKHGENGWHPHIHVLLRTEEWSEDELDALTLRWRTAVRRALGHACLPSDEHGLSWSPPFEATDASARTMYLAKLGLEVAGFGKAGGRSRTPWEIASDGCDGDSRSVWLWHEYATATRGKRMLELDDRASDAAKKQLLLEHADDNDPEEPTEPPKELPVARDDVRALRRLERRIPAIFAVVLRAAEEEGLGAAQAWVEYARRNAWIPTRAREGPCLGIELHDAPS